MIPRVGDFVPFGAPDSPVPRVAHREALALAIARARRPGDDVATEALQRTFRLALLEAMSRAKTEAPAPRTAPPLPPALASPPAAPPPPAGPSAVDASATSRDAAMPADPAPDAPSPSRPAAVEEGDVIASAARRSGVDARFLQALRRAENGRPGREFGVLSVPAPTYEDQARVAAESVRRSVERFERTGRVAIDAGTGLYTDEFISFFSSRWAPIGAANDPTGLNRHHARNLMRLYARVAPKQA